MVHPARFALLLALLFLPVACSSGASSDVGAGSDTSAVAGTDGALEDTAADASDTEDAADSATDAAEADGVAADTQGDDADVTGDAPVDVGSEADALPDDATGDAADVADATPAADVVDADAERDPAADTVPDATPVFGPRFVRLPDTGLQAHDPVTEGTTDRSFAYGYGMTPFDADGDGDLDLFVGTVPDSTLPACVYENVSTAGRVRFATRREWCAPLTDQPTAALAVDPEGDGVSELIAMTDDQLWFVRLEDGWSAIALQGGGEECVFGSGAVVDIDHDGQLDVVTGCLLDFRGRRGPEVRGTEWSWDTSTEAWNPRASTRFAPEAYVLGFGVLDIDEDGLLDVASIVDTLATPDSYDSTRNPGGVALGCVPGDSCDAVTIPWHNGGAAWGSFMSLEPVRIGAGREFILGDHGPPGVFTWGDGGGTVGTAGFPDDIFGTAIDEYPFSWGTLRDDWNDDGLDDLVIASGYFSSNPMDITLIDHRDRCFVQGLPGSFVPVESGLAFEPHSDHLVPSTGAPRASRAAVRFDADLDGTQEIIILAVNGPPFVYRHSGAIPRCTIRPRPSVVETAGAAGYRWRAAGGSWRLGPVHGETLSSDAPVVIVPSGSGELEFPSGARVRYECGAGGALDLDEPEWLRLSSDARGAVVSIDAAGWRGEAPTNVSWMDDAPGATLRTAEPIESGLWLLSDSLPDHRIMLQLDGRWVGRWLSPTERP